jgi:hypothetical protein
MPSSAFINAIRDAGTKDDALSALQQAWDERCAAKDKVKELESLCDDLENRLSEKQAEIMLLTHRSVSATEEGDRPSIRYWGLWEGPRGTWSTIDWQRPTMKA